MLNFKLLFIQSNLIYNKNIYTLNAVVDDLGGNIIEIIS